MGATLKGAQAYNTPLILFGVLCGGSGSKKSAPIRIVKEVCEAVEALDSITVQKSSINASASMESLCCELEKQPNLIQVWDEFSVFLGLFGSTRIVRTAYDRGLLCELYSPTGMVCRQLVTRQNVMIKPRLNIIAAAKKFIKEIIYNYDVVSSDKSNDDDFIASLYQKSIERVERLSLALHILKNSARRLFSMTENIQSFPIFDDRFKTICTGQQLTEAEHLINYDTTFRASLLTKFDLNPTKILAGYDPTTDIVIGNNKSAISLVSFYLLDTMDIPPEEVNHIKKYIENHPCDHLLLLSLPANLKRKISKDQYLSILREMEEEGKGKIEETNNVKEITVLSSLTERQTTEGSSINHELGNEPSLTNHFSN
ncbi:unnamed protein product [Rotaria sp. Silwood1]|nr:unnamed protein product [Rotaria sp. Silwood1]